MAQPNIFNQQICYACCKTVNSINLLQLEKDSEDYPSVICDQCLKIYEQDDVKSKINSIWDEASELVEKIEKQWLFKCKQNI
jgi:hypothetical protein